MFPSKQNLALNTQFAEGREAVCPGPQNLHVEKTEQSKLSILKRIEEIVLNAEARLRNNQHAEADPSQPSTEQNPSSETHAENDVDREMRLELVEC